VDPGKVRLLGVLIMITENHGYPLPAAEDYGGDHEHLFVYAPPKNDGSCYGKCFQMSFYQIFI
jgi:hypothetical protein